MESPTYINMMKTINEYKQENTDLRLMLYNAQSKLREILGEEGSESYGDDITDGREAKIRSLEAELEKRNQLISRAQNVLESVMAANNNTNAMFCEQIAMLEADREAEHIRHCRTLERLARYMEANKLLILEIKHKQSQLAKAVALLQERKGM